MDFLAADVAALQEPEEGELEAWFSQNPNLFAIPPHVSFRHLYFSPDKRGNAARSDAEAALNAITANPTDLDKIAASADSIALRNYYSDSTPNFLLKEFGPTFASALFNLQPGAWRGPIQSGFGWHLIWIDALVPGRIPSYPEVEPEVATAWHDAVTVRSNVPRLKK